MCKTCVNLGQSVSKYCGNAHILYPTNTLGRIHFVVKGLVIYSILRTFYATLNTVNLMIFNLLISNLSTVYTRPIIRAIN